jgi:6-phosphogluconolactonase
MGNSVDVLAWDTQKGTLTRIQNISTLPAGFSGESTAGTVRVDSTGRNLYASNRGADTIAVFSVDSAKGTLREVQQISCGGKIPRHFALDPSNRWLVAANQDSANIVIFSRSASNGRLRYAGKQVSLDSPACVVFS